jgi:acyl-CoA dehydrogenase
LDLTLPPEVEAIRARAAAFVDERLLPLEAEPASFGEGEHVRDDLLQELRAEARARGLWCPQMPRGRGGLGFGPVEVHRMIVARTLLEEGRGFFQWR